MKRIRYPLEIKLRALISCILILLVFVFIGFGVYVGLSPFFLSIYILFVTVLIYLNIVSYGRLFYSMGKLHALIGYKKQLEKDLEKIKKNKK